MDTKLLITSIAALLMLLQIWFSTVCCEIQGKGLYRYWSVFWWLQFEGTHQFALKG